MTQYTKPTPEEIKNKLTPTQFAVTQEEATEHPFDNEYFKNTEAGIYVDVVTGEPLFSSRDKYDPGTGWPTFVRPIKADILKLEHDHSFGMERVKVSSATGGSHLGHVFISPNASTGQSYCMNSASLRFIPKNQMEAEGYGEYLKEVE